MIDFLEASVAIIVAVKVATAADPTCPSIASTISDAAASKTTTDVQASAVVVFVEAAAAVEAFSVVVVAVLILIQKCPAKMNRTANMVNPITAAVALSFTNAKNADLSPSCTLLVEATTVAVIAAATFDSTNAVLYHLLCTTAIPNKTENLNVIDLAIPCALPSLLFAERHLPKKMSKSSIDRLTSADNSNKTVNMNAIALSISCSLSLS